MVVAPPGKGELAGGKTVDRSGDDTSPGDRGGVATCEQADPPIVDEGFVGLVGTGDLGADDRGAAVAVADGQPVVTERTGALGEGEEGLLQQIFEVHGASIGKVVLVGHRHEAGLFDHHREAVAAGLRKGQPHERDVGRPVGESCGRVGPADLAERDSCIWMLEAEPGADGGKQAAAAGAGAHADDERGALGPFHLLNGGARCLPSLEDSAGVGEKRPAGGAEANLALAPFEQGHPEGALQHADLLGEGGLGDVELLRRPREVQLGRDGHEVPEVAGMDIHNQWLSQQVLDVATVRPHHGVVDSEPMRRAAGQTTKGTPKVWLVTGASSGFGRALLEAAVAAGGVVVAAARRASTLDDLVASYPDQIDPVQLDVTDHERIEEVVAEAVGRHGRIDVLVNNAGRTHVGAVEEATDAELRSLFEVHLFGPAALVRAVLPHMRERHSGTIVQMSSMGGQLSFAGFSAYSATKFALEGLSGALADEVRPFGIKVLVVEPGAFRTGLFRSASESDTSDTYSGSVGMTREMVSTGDGAQPGDPAKAAHAILAALDAEQTPLRLPLGADAIDAISAHLDAVRSELRAWETVARDTLVD